jgi:hypothetical protein
MKFAKRFKAKKLAFGEVEFWPDGPRLGTLSGLCSDCADDQQARVTGQSPSGFCCGARIRSDKR